MKGILLCGFLFLQIFYACTGKEEESTPSDDIETARTFIRSALDGNYKQARTLILPDSLNGQYLDLYQRNYRERMTLADKTGYRESSINIHSLAKVNDTTTVVRYSNSFKKRGDSVMVVQKGGRWLVDLKYSFPKIDSLP
jgi:hypothetical protein